MLRAPKWPQVLKMRPKDDFLGKTVVHVWLLLELSLVNVGVFVEKLLGELLYLLFWSHIWWPRAPKIALF